MSKKMIAIMKKEFARFFGKKEQVKNMEKDDIKKLVLQIGRASCRERV